MSKLEKDLEIEIMKIFDKHKINYFRKDISDDLVALFMTWMENCCDDCERIHPDDIGEYVASMREH